MGMTIEGRITTTGSESIFSTTRASPRDLVNAYVFGRSPRILLLKYSCQNILVPLQSCPPLLVRHRVGNLLVHPLDGLNDLVGIGRRGVRLLLQMPLVQMTIGRGDMTKHLQYIVGWGSKRHGHNYLLRRQRSFTQLKEVIQMNHKQQHLRPNFSFALPSPSYTWCPAYLATRPS